MVQFIMVSRIYAESESRWPLSAPMKHSNQLQPFLPDAIGVDERDIEDNEFTPACNPARTAYLGMRLKRSDRLENTVTPRRQPFRNGFVADGISRVVVVNPLDGRRVVDSTFTARTR